MPPGIASDYKETISKDPTANPGPKYQSATFQLSFERQMDAFYDKDKAGNELEKIAHGSREALSCRTLSTVFHLADIELENTNVQATNAGRRNWRLCSQSEDDMDVSDELVVRMQGIVTKNNLVPRNVQSCSPSKAQFLSQFIEICGAGSASFAGAIQNLKSVHERFSQQLAGVDVLPMPDVSARSQDAFAASNRIFTPKSDVPTEQDNTFQDGVDSAGLLNKLKRDEYIHAPENVVLYFRKKSTPDDESLQYVPFFPGGFRVGDIVELQVSFVAIASAMNKVKITTRLHAVTLLDNQFTTAATTARASTVTAQVAAPAIRRKIGYFIEDEEEARKSKKQRKAEEQERMMQQ
ncbi:hypothetical protein C8R46DRAFT_1209878 [Mycena filopes]|nr:hypothetical protein C8R46DRAFT_1209878 [Mycena filopes]